MNFLFSKQMDKSWIHHRNRLSTEYADGVRKFIDIARNHVNSDGDTLVHVVNA